jgi:5'-3' exonuclease
MKAKKGKLAIIDADGLLFYAGYHYRDSLNMLGEMGAKDRLDRIITALLNKIDATHYVGFFGQDGTKNFRHDWATVKPYKGNRHNDPWQDFFKPLLKKHFEEKWKFIPVARLEADDAVIIAHHQYKDDYNIVHVAEDKDMRQLGEYTRLNPSNRSNPSKKIDHSEHEHGRKFFWAQHLHGK